MGRKAKEIHPFNTAKQVVQVMGVKNRDDYREKYKTDPMLPSEPDKKYAEWVSWEEFLGIEVPRYKTYVEAAHAVRRLKIEGFTDYRAKYKEDALLPPAPDLEYPAEWEGWAVFVGKSQYHEKYLTVEEAAAAAKRLGIPTKKEYELRYLEDAKLPVSPHKMYAEHWPGWGAFLEG